MATPPVVRISEFAVSGVNPSGLRHLTTAGAYVKELGTAAGQFLDYGQINISLGKQSSKTAAVVAMIDDTKDLTEAMFNLRFYLSDISSFGPGTYNFNGFPSGQWIQDVDLTDASGYFIPTTLPSGQNWWRDGGGPFNREAAGFQEITASGTDSQVTQFYYLSVTVDQDVPNKVYGGNAGGFVYRLTYDFR